MKEVNWQKWKCRASLLHVLFTEPQSKAAKEAGELSKTAKTALRKAYIQYKWGRSKEIKTKQMDKGKLVQDEIMDMMSFFEDKQYIRNAERRSNEWIDGECDCVHECIDDFKASWEPESFIPNLEESISDEYWYQVQGYMWLWNKQSARVIWGLVNCPEMILKNERMKLLYSMNVATELDPDYLEAAREMEKNLIFDDIPMSERIIIENIQRDEEVIARIPQKVTKAREYLMELDEKHSKMTRRVAGEPMQPQTFDINSIPLIKIK